jgi:hypothetical protein
MRARRCEIHGFSANEIGNDADSVQMARLQQRRHPGLSDGSVRYWPNSAVVGIRPGRQLSGRELPTRGTTRDG